MSRIFLMKNANLCSHSRRQIANLPRGAAGTQRRRLNKAFGCSVGEISGLLLKTHITCRNILKWNYGLFYC